MSEAKDDLIARLESVAWRVKDYADGWIFYTDEKRARIEAEIMSGALVEPLYSASTIASLTEQVEALRATNCKLNRDAQLAHRSAYRDAKKYIRGLYAETTKRYLAIFHKTRRALQARIIEDMGVHIDELAKRMTARAEAAEATVSRLTAENEKLREALKPFAAVADRYSDREYDNFETWRDCREPEVKEASKLVHFRRARASLSNTSEGGKGE